MSKQLVLFSKGSGLTSKDRERLSKAGFLALEVPYPGDVRMLIAAGAEFGGSEMLLMALKAINESPYDSRAGIRQLFTQLLAKSLERTTSNPQGKL